MQPKTPARDSTAEAGPRTCATRRDEAGAARGAPRCGPRPLALHLALARAAWADREPDRFARFLDGLEAYWRHPYRRDLPEPPVLWARGTSRLLDYGPAGGMPLLVVPSLINRAYILDLMPGRSLVRHLAENGIRPLLIDWGAPGPAERRMTLDDFITERLESALDVVRGTDPRRPLMLGYCMGGLLALALATRRGADFAGLALLATPWDFQADGLAVRQLTPLRAAEAAAGRLGGAPVELIQMLFASLDPLSVARKFVRFAALDPASPDAATFVAVEDWLNDGVALSAEVAHACLVGWYVENRPLRGLWKVAGHVVDPATLGLPCLVAIPTRDRIVPPASAAALARALPAATVVCPASGHIGMVVGGAAVRRLWEPLTAWLRRIAAMQK